MTANRPAAACLLCPPPTTSETSWRLADSGYRTCAACLDSLRELLRDVVARYLRLTAQPGDAGEQGRGSPGFGSRPPASVHIIAMRDRRSKPLEWSRDGVAYVWDPLADHALEPDQLGPPRGEYVEKLEVWYGRDGRPHTEAARPPRSPLRVLEGIAELVAEERVVDSPLSTEACPAAHRPHSHVAWRAGRPSPAGPPDPPIVRTWRWLDRQLDWVTRQPWVDDVARDLRELDGQLRPVTGEPGARRIGECPNTIDEGETTRPCRAWLYAPLKGDTITCRACGRAWHYAEWMQLGKLLGGVLT